MSKVVSRNEAAGLTALPGGGCLGWWKGETVLTEAGAVREALQDLSRAVFVVRTGEELGVGVGGVGTLGAESGEGLAVVGFAPAMDLRRLGDAGFCGDHGVRFPYMTGAMANGIASVEVVVVAARAGLLGSFGAAGLRVGQIEKAIERLQSELGAGNQSRARKEATLAGEGSGGLPYCFNLIHSPNEMAHEMGVVELYLRKGVRVVEAAAFLDLTLPAVLYRVAGIYRGEEGEVVTPNRVIAKVSRTEVATKWFSPPPAAMLAQLVTMGKITREQAGMAGEIPMAQDVTAEADSAGHTDNRPAMALLPTMLGLRDRMQERFGYAKQLRVGLGGGIGTPAAAAAAFAMGAAYIVTGSVNQACVESGSSDRVRLMLAQTQQADVTMAPAADMFEMGVKLQVIKRGTMFPMRAGKLLELYRAYGSLGEIPKGEREAIEKTIFREPLEGIWEKTKAFFREIDPSHVERAERDGKHKMALVFRWYLGLSSRWANAGDAGRVMDYQVWCGPAMGAFNEWVKGSFMEEVGNRRVGEVGLNLMVGAGVVTRMNMLRGQGVRVGGDVGAVRPRGVRELGV